MSQLRYPAYKPSGVEWLGEIPAHWSALRSRFILEANPSLVRLKELNNSDEVSFVPMEAVGELGGLNLEQNKLLEEIGSGYTEFEDGDVVVAKITPCFENGKGAHARHLTNGIAFGTTELHVLRAKEKLNPRFLFYLTISYPFRKLGEAAMYGAGGQKRVPPEFVKDFRTPLPPLEEQQTIADFLDAKTAQIDTLMEKKRQLVARLKEKRGALIARTVTRGLPPDAAQAAGLEPHPAMKDSGVEWLGEIPTTWEIKRLKYVANRSEVKIEAEEDNPLPYIGMEHVESWTGRLLPLDEELTPTGVSNFFKCGDTLFGKLRPYLAKACNVEFEGLCSSELLVLRGKNYEPRFLLYQLLSTDFINLVDSSTYGSKMPRASWDFIGSCELAWPPLEEQQTIVTYLDRETARIDQLVAKVEDAIARLTEYRQALITAAVTGKINVGKVLP